MTEFLTAKQASELSEKNNQNLVKILDKIKERAENGHNDLFGEELTINTRNKLEELGYHVYYEREVTDTGTHYCGEPVRLTSIESEIIW